MELLIAPEHFQLHGCPATRGGSCSGSREGACAEEPGLSKTGESAEAIMFSSAASLCRLEEKGQEKVKEKAVIDKEERKSTVKESASQQAKDCLQDKVQPWVAIGTEYVWEVLEGQIR